MKTLFPAALVLAAALAAAGSASAQTLGERLDSGQISQAAFTQLIADTGLSPDEARSKTLNEIAFMRTDIN